MANNNPFLRAHYEKTVLTKQTSKRIQKIYEQSAKDIEKKLKTLKLINPSDSLKKVYFENLLKDIKNSQDSFNRMIESTVKSAGEQAGNIAIEAGNKMMEKAGLTMKGAFSYVPREQIAKIATGQVYEGKWSLSQSIWRSSLRTQSDIQNVVAKGLAENKPIKDIADDLTKYVRPEARKPWNWNKVYPGTAAKVDYNAQRLARTMIQHSYQACLVESQRYNPFCNGIMWHSVGLHGRTCETCLERDGNIFPVKDLPLDHPNGLCYFEPYLDHMEMISSYLGDWVNDKDSWMNDYIDTYVEKAFGLDPKSLLSRPMIEKLKAETLEKASKVKSKPFSEQEYINGVKKNQESKMLLDEKRKFANLKEEYYNGIRTYSGSAYEEMNGFLRMVGRGEAAWGDGTIYPELEREIRNAQKGLATVANEETIYLRRGSDLGDLAGLLGGDFEEDFATLKSFVRNWSDDFDTFEEAIAHLNMQFEGTVGVFDGFTSTSSLWDRGFDDSVEYVFKAPPGTAGGSIMTISKFGTSEGEYLLNAGTRVKVKKISVSDGHMDSKIRIFLEIIP